MTVHGGNIVATAKALGCAIDELLDMSSNLTPLGAVPGLLAALTDGLEQIAYLPETESESLRALFAARYGLAEDEVVVGNGTTEFIFAIPKAFRGGRAIIGSPTYGDYQLACAWAGVAAEPFMLDAERGYQLDFDALAARLRGEELVFLCNPNNPTGLLTPSAELRNFCVAHPRSFFLVDESYLPFTKELSLLDFELPSNLFVLFSSSKIYGIPGLRLGFLASRAANLRRVSERRKPWGVNRLAQLAGEYVLRHGEPYVEQIRDFIAEERPWFVRRLSQCSGVEVIRGEANFILSRLTGDMRAGALRDRMLQERIMIRNCDNFVGLDDRFFRVSLKRREANERCLRALSALLGPA